MTDITEKMECEMILWDIKTTIKNIYYIKENAGIKKGMKNRLLMKCNNKLIFFLYRVAN